LPGAIRGRGWHVHRGPIGSGDGLQTRLVATRSKHHRMAEVGSTPTPGSKCLEYDFPPHSRSKSRKCRFRKPTTDTLVEYGAINADRIVILTEVARIVSRGISGDESLGSVAGRADTVFWSRLGLDGECRVVSEVDVTVHEVQV
jgi:hypothetical protein